MVELHKGVQGGRLAVSFHFVANTYVLNMCPWHIVSKKSLI